MELNHFFILLLGCASRKGGKQALCFPLFLIRLAPRSRRQICHVKGGAVPAREKSRAIILRFVQVMACWSIMLEVFVDGFQQDEDDIDDDEVQVKEDYFCQKLPVSLVTTCTRTCTFQSNIAQANPKIRIAREHHTKTQPILLPQPG